VIYRVPIMLDNEFQVHLAQAANQPAPEQAQFDLLAPNSHCPQCKSPLPWWANIPLISYIALLGKSHCCRQPIARRYPLVELLCMIVSLYAAYHFGFSWQTVAALVLCWGLIALLFIDVDQFLLPDDITLSLLWIGLWANLFNTFAPIHDAVIGAIAGYSIFWSVGYLFKRLRGIDGLGQGDYKLLAMLGAWLGWQQLPLIILASSFLGAIYGAMMLIFNRQHHRDPIPFGPFLAVAAVIGLFWGNELITAFLGWHGIHITSLHVLTLC